MKGSSNCNCALAATDQRHVIIFPNDFKGQLDQDMEKRIVNGEDFSHKSWCCSIIQGVQY